MSSFSLMYLYEPDWPSRNVDYLLWQHETSARIRALVCAIGKGTQMAEDLSFGVLVGTALDVAEGPDLDWWAAMVGEERGALTGDQLRLIIDLRVIANSQFCNTDNMYLIISTGFDPSNVVSYPMAPGGRQYHVESLAFTPEPLPERIGAIVADFKPLTMSAPIIEVVPDHFALDWEDDPTVISEGLGNDVLSKLLYSGR